MPRKKIKKKVIWREEKFVFSNKKKWLLTDAFLIDLKNELDDAIDSIDDSPIPVKERSYFNTYFPLVISKTFSDCLEKVSKKHNVYKAIYLYDQQLPWYHSDIFLNEIVDIMIEKNIMPFELPIDKEIDDDIENAVKEMVKNGEARYTEEIKHYNGYYVTKKDWEVID